MDPRITLTLGPSSEDSRMIRSLLPYATRFRLNASHLTPDTLAEWLTRLARLFAETGRSLPVVVDLQGAKMRIGRIPTVDRLPEQVSLVLGQASDDITVIPVPHPDLFVHVKAGERLTLNDRRVELEVALHCGERLEAVVMKNGPLSSFKGINRPDHPLPYEEITGKDRAMIGAAMRYPFTAFAFSFVHTGSEAALLRGLTDRPLIAKLERPEAMEYLDRIDREFDEIWFCRGDMGAQAGLERLGDLQESMVQAIGSLSSPVVLAGQVLHHLTVSSEPTRAEVVGLHRTARDGFAGVVLSDETATGRYPEAAARVACTYYPEV